jgi:hypothetical protein
MVVLFRTEMGHPSPRHLSLRFIHKLRSRRPGASLTWQMPDPSRILRKPHRLDARRDGRAE